MLAVIVGSCDLPITDGKATLSRWLLGPDFADRRIDRVPIAEDGV